MSAVDVFAGKWYVGVWGAGTMGPRAIDPTPGRWRLVHDEVEASRPADWLIVKLGHWGDIGDWSYRGLWQRVDFAWVLRDSNLCSVGFDC